MTWADTPPIARIDLDLCFSVMRVVLFRLLRGSMLDLVRLARLFAEIGGTQLKGRSIPTFSCGHRQSSRS